MPPPLGNTNGREASLLPVVVFVLIAVVLAVLAVAAVPEVLRLSHALHLKTK